MLSQPAGSTLTWVTSSRRQYLLQVICILVDQHPVQLHRHPLVLPHPAVLLLVSKSQAIMELVMAVTVATR